MLLWVKSYFISNSDLIWGWVSTSGEDSDLVGSGDFWPGEYGSCTIRALLEVLLHMINALLYFVSLIICVFEAHIDHTFFIRSNA